MEGMEGQPIKMFGKGTAQGTWEHNEQRYCEGNGCGECTGLVYEEYGSGEHAVRNNGWACNYHKRLAN